jgi:hypothetical protein
MLRIGRKECPYCRRSSEIFMSQPKSIWEELLVLILLFPVRCHDCMHRFYRPIFVATAILPTSVVGRKSARPAQSTEKDHKRSA